MDIGLAGALLGGVLTLLSPCSAVLLPGFFAYAFSARSALLGRTMLFYLGLLVTLVPLGVAASTLGALVNEHRRGVVLVLSLLVIVLGVLQLCGVEIPLPGRTTNHRRDARAPVAVFLLGTVYGIAGVCSGPILGSVLAVAALGGDPAYGALVLAVYALGMAVPVFVLALLWDRFDLAHRRWLRPRPIRLGPIRTTLTGLVAGLLMISIGVLLLATEGTGNLGGLVSADTQFRLESWLSGWAAAIPDYLLIGAAIVVGAVIAFIWAGRRSRARDGQED